MQKNPIGKRDDELKRSAISSIEEKILALAAEFTTTPDLAIARAYTRAVDAKIDLLSGTNTSYSFYSLVEGIIPLQVLDIADKAFRAALANNLGGGDPATIILAHQLFQNTSNWLTKILSHKTNTSPDRIR